MKLRRLYERVEDSIDGHVTKLLGIYEDDRDQHFHSLIGTWDVHHGRWIPSPTSIDRRECDALNKLANARVKLCYNCKGLKEVRVKDGGYWRDRSCPTCKGLGVLDRFTGQEEMQL